MAISSKRFDCVVDTAMSITFLEWLGSEKWSKTQSRIALLTFPIWVVPWFAMTVLVCFGQLLILPFAIALDVWNQD